MDRINNIAPSHGIKMAANWYLANKHDNATRFTPRIMDKFGLTPKQVVKAFLLAEQISSGRVS